MLTLFYAVCLVGGLLFTILSAIFGHFSAHTDGMHIGTGGHAEAGFDDAGIPGISFFSPVVVASFITAFGGLGTLFTDIPATSSVWISAPLATLGAVLIAFGVFWGFNKIFTASQSSSEAHVGALVGQTASLLTPIPENGVGEIAYVHASTRYTAPARSEKGVPVASGRPVRITRVVGTQFYVEPI